MIKHIRKVGLAAAALAALALGGSALAQAGSSPSTPSPAKASKVSHATKQGKAEMQAEPAEAAGSETPDAAGAGDTDQVQSGDQSAPDTEKADGADEAVGSEVPGDDGPGGHADEPGNPNADHQAEGQE
jgi:hypothetical protein